VVASSSTSTSTSMSTSTSSVAPVLSVPGPTIAVQGASLSRAVARAVQPLAAQAALAAVAPSCGSPVAIALSNADFSGGLSGWSTDYVPGDFEGGYFLGASIGTIAPRFLAYTPDFGAKSSGNIFFLNASTMPATRVLSRTLSMTPGATYRMRFWARRAALPGAITATVGSVSASLDLSLSPNGWSAVDLVFTAPAATAAFQVVETTNVAGGADFAVSNFELSTCASVAVAQVNSVTATPAGVTTPGSAPDTVADPVNTATGGFDHSAVDLFLPGRGVGLEFGRSYDSRQSASSSFGPGWWNSYFENVSVSPTSGVLSWRMPSGGQIDFVPDGTGGFVSPAGVLAIASVSSGGGWDVKRQDQVVDHFDLAGKLVSRLDRSGQGVALAYSSLNRLTTVTDSAGQKFTFSYGAANAGAAAGLLTKIVSSDGRTISFGYGFVAGQNRLVSFTDERKKITTYEYDTNGFLVTQVDPLAHSEFTNIYDAVGRVVDQADALGKHSTFVYDDVAGITTMTDAEGAVRTFRRPGNISYGETNPAGSTVKAFDAKLNLTSFTDPNGKQFTATYDARGNMTGRTGPTGLVETWTYDAGNNVLTQTDTTGVVTSYTYDLSGRVISEVKAGEQRIYIWNGDGTLNSSSDPLGRLTAYAYDPLGRLTSQTSPGGGITTYEYDAAGRMIRMVPPRGNLPGANPAAFDMLYKYDKAGNQTTVQGPGVRTVSVYDDANRLVTKTEADGGVTSYVYNAAGEVTSMTGPDGGVTSYEYSNRGERVSQVDPVGAKTTWTYDGAGRMVTMVEPRGNIAGANPTDYQWTYGYDAVGRKVSETDPLGRVSSTTYDALGRATNQTRPDGSTATVFDPVLQERKVTTTDQAGRSNTTELDALGRVVKTTDARGFVTQSTYDAVGNRLSQTAPDSGVTTWTYDSENRVTSMVDPRGNTPPALPAAFTTTYTYDIEGHQVSSTDPLGRVTQTVFDTAGRADTTTDPAGKVTNLAYDAVGRVRQVNQTGQGATKYTYDTAGNLRTRIDPLLRNTLYDYDLGRRLVKQTDPAGRFSTFGYDLEGRRTLMVDQKANAAGNPSLGSTSYAYDRLGRVLSRSYSDGTAAVSYTYDAAGRRATMVDGTGTTTYGYDSANRVVTKTLPSGAVMAYTFDAANNVLTASDGSGGTATRTYDPVGRLKTVADEAGNVTTYSYDPAGFLVSTVLPGGVRQDRVVDAAGQIGQIANSGSAGLIRSVQYTRDGSGNPTAAIASGPAGVLEAQSQLFTYDNANRLRKACWTAVACKNANQTAWTYDVVGKRLTEKVGAAPAKAFTYDPQTDQLTQTVDGTQVTNFVYDANGNQTQSGGTVSTFNAANQTVSITEAAIGSTYTYDGDGLRVSDTLNQFGTLQTTRFDWDTVSSGLANVVADHRTGANGVNDSRFTYGLGLVSSEESNHVRSFALTDPLGTITQTSSNTGVVRWYGSTGPFGDLHDSVAASGFDPYGVELLKYRFTGQYEAGFGLTHMRARNYNASLGAFTQTDPMPMGAGSSFEATYVYAGDNPVSFSDPSGMRKSSPGLVGAPPLVVPRIPSPAPGVGSNPIVDVEPGLPFIPIIAIPAPGLPKDTILSSEDWPLGQKQRPKRANKILNGIRVLFRSASGSPQSLTPRPGKDTDGYPANGLSTYVYPNKCSPKCVVLSVDILEAHRSLISLAPDFKDPLHVFIQGTSNAEHLAWAANRESAADSDLRTGAVTSAIIGFWNWRLLAA
jgi:RHS repeat-associated protein